MIFCELDKEALVRVGDKTRLDASVSYVTKDEGDITLIRIKPETSASYYDVTDDGILDWSFSTFGDNQIEVEVTTAGSQDTRFFNIVVVDESVDIHFSSDSDLVNLEDDIMKYVRDGRNTYLDKHRTARNTILDTLDSNRIYKEDGSRYSVTDVSDLNDFNRWSTYMVLSMIYGSLSQQSGDFYSSKSAEYKKLESEARNRSFFRLKPDSETTEEIDTFSGEIYRR